MFYPRDLFSIVFVFLFASLAFPQTNHPDVKFNMDFGRYRYDDQNVYMEVCYAAYLQSVDPMIFEQTDYYQTDLKFKIIDAESDSVLAQDNVPLRFFSQEVVGGSSPAAKMGLLKLVVPKGKYRLWMASISDTVVYDVSVSPFTGDRISLSDLEICSNIIPHSQNKDHVFYKNTMEVYPNPSLIFGQGNPRLYYYQEVYNLKQQGVDPNAPVVIQVAIADQEGNVRAKKEYHRNHSVESTVERGAFDVRKFETGLYTLIFAVSDSATNTAVYRRRNFYVYNPDVVLVREDTETGMDFMSSMFSEMPESTLDEMFAQAEYIATESEKRVYRVLNSVESKRQFMFNFWKARNKEKPNWQQEYYERVAYANEHFSYGTKPGWQTDRGRVYIIY